MITTQGLTKAYGQSTVVDDVNIAIAQGGVTSIIGANGAGKSTLLTMIARLKEPTAGEVLLDGRDVRRVDGRELARQMSILRQENHLTARLSVREIVSFGRYPYSGGKLTPEDHRKVDEALEYMDLKPLASRNLDQLSGGQRQRAFVAMILAQDTSYVLLDEPLNNLDMRHSVAMMKLIRRTADELGKTVVIVIHDVNFAASYSDQILALKDGHVVAYGAPDEIMTPETLHAIYDCDVEVVNVGGRPVAVYF